MKNTSIIIGVVILAGIGFWLMQDKNVETTTNTTTQTPAQTPAETKTPAKTANKPSTPVQDTRSYTDLVKEYEGKRIQFDQYCQAIPASVTYKNGTSIMLDNRSGDARYVRVGSDEHYLAGYGYKIITLVGTNFPVDVNISCGAAVNVGKILLQSNISNTQ